MSSSGSASQAIKAGPSRRSQPNALLPLFVTPQLSLTVEKRPSGLQWVHEIKVDGFRMAARLDNGRVQLLTRTGLDWTAKYPGAVAALARVNVKTAYLDGELCGVDENYTDDGKLTYAGRAGTGMPVKVLATCAAAWILSPASERPAAAQHALRSSARLSRAHWVEPRLVAEVTYLTWTTDNLLRHTVYVGLREDKPADQVPRES